MGTGFVGIEKARQLIAEFNDGKQSALAVAEVGTLRATIAERDRRIEELMDAAYDWEGQR